MIYKWMLSKDLPCRLNVLIGLQPRETRTERGPQLVAGLLPFNCGGNPVHISASDQHSCVVTDAGDLFTWGTCDEEGGALGHSHERWQPVAKRVPLLKKVRSALYSGLAAPLLAAGDGGELSRRCKLTTI